MQIIRYLQIVFTGIILYMYVFLMYIYKVIQVPVTNKLAVMQVESSDLSYTMADLFINKFSVTTFLTVTLVFILVLIWVPGFFMKKAKKEQGVED